MQDKRFFMRSNACIAILWFILLPAPDLLSQTGSPVQWDGKSPKNILLFISDGWGYNHIKATNYYMDGMDSTQDYQQFPVHYAMSTYPARMKDDRDVRHWHTGYNSHLAWSDFEYLKKNPTGSAEAATAMATGRKTYGKSIGMGEDLTPLFNITSHAKAMGKSAGVVSSVQLSHATPAGFVAHNANRKNYAEIAREMLLDSKMDVIMGAGHPLYNRDGIKQDTGRRYDYVGGLETWTDLESGKLTYTVPGPSGNHQVQDVDGDGRPDAWTLVQSRDAFKALMEGPTPKRVCAIPMVHSTLQQGRSGSDIKEAYGVPFIPTVPTLAEMTEAALNVLDNNASGFFIMVEGGAVDWANHDNHGGRMIEEQHDFNLAVKAAIRWIELNGGWEDNLLIVTGDHECGYLTGPLEKEASPVRNPIINNGAGEMPGMRFNHDEHTNMLIPVFAKGKGSALFHLFADEVDYLRGPYINNTEIAQLMFLLWSQTGKE